MNLIYLTSKKFPSNTADHFFVRDMADAFNKILKDRFVLVLANDTGFFPGVKVVSTNLHNEKGRALYYFFWLPFFIFRNKYSTQHTFFFSNDPNLLVNLIIMRKFFGFKYKICSEWHMLYDDWRDAFIVKNSDCLVATSKVLRKIILEKTKINVPGDRFLVTYGGVHVDKYIEIDKVGLRTKLNLPQDKVLVAYIGLLKTLGAKKGIDTMIEALSYLPEKVNMVVVGGKKEEMEELRNSVDPALLTRCTFVESQPAEIVPEYQKAVDILVIPSPNKPPFSNYLLPMKVYEYLASRKPIVYSKLLILEEILGDCGYGVVPEDANDLAKMIESILNSTSGDIKQKTDICYSKALRSSWMQRAREIVDFLSRSC